MNEPLIRVENLKKQFPIGHWPKHDRITALDGVSLEIRPGETLGLVGESGCGKTTLGRTILRLTEPDSGRIFYNGEDITGRGMAPIRQKMQMVFQDPYTSLDPMMTAGNIIAEPLDIHKLCGSRQERAEKVAALLEAVGLSAGDAESYPRSFSGGQRQRIGIARALAAGPSFLVCDEPVSALDLSIQAQILNLLGKLQKELRLSCLFISHDLAVVRHISDRVGVMYLGEIVEMAGTEELYSNPLHPYTKALMSAIPSICNIGTVQTKKIILTGEAPSPIHPPSGCKFHTRCPAAEKICALRSPPLLENGQGHFCACHKTAIRRS